LSVAEVIFFDALKYCKMLGGAPSRPADVLPNESQNHDHYETKKLLFNNDHKPIPVRGPGFPGTF
jgi:hypothetical protein